MAAGRKTQAALDVVAQQELFAVRVGDDEVGDQVRAMRPLSSSWGRSAVTRAVKEASSKPGQAAFISRPIRAIRSGLNARSFRGIWELIRPP